MLLARCSLLALRLQSKCRSVITGFILYDLAALAPILDGAR